MGKARKIRLLAPGGGMDGVVAAVNAGCDAVYVGGRAFSARAGAENFDEAGLAACIDFCHLRGVEVYIAANTLLLDSEIPALLSFLDKAYQFGADAFIFQDLGAAAFAREIFKDIEFHASTQLTAANARDCEFLAKAGFSRVILSRELSLPEIRHIHENVEIELEAFVHGALCFCYSGRCQMSSAIGARSGNRGTCAQPCRHAYMLQKGGKPASERGYLLSPKDMATLDILDEIIDAGVSSLKIEGRMRSSEYTAITTLAYRERLDALARGDRTVSQKAKRDALQIFNRGGASLGYYKEYSGAGLMSVQSPKAAGLKIGEVVSANEKTGEYGVLLADSVAAGDGVEIHTRTEPHPGKGINHAANAGEVVTLRITGADIRLGDAVYRSFDKRLADFAADIVKNRKRRTAIIGCAKITSGRPAELSLERGGIRVTAFGSVPSAAKNRPLAPETVAERLEKSGNSPFDIEIREIKLADGLFMTAADLNELRRRAVAELEKAVISQSKRSPAQIPTLPTPERAALKETPEFTALVSNREQLAAIFAGNMPFSRVYIEAGREAAALLREFRRPGCPLFLALPDIERHGGEENLAEAASLADGFLVRTLGQLSEYAPLLKPLVADHTLNAYNSLTLDYLSRYCVTAALSTELSAREAAALAGRGAEAVVYGKRKLMTTALCPIGLYAADKGSSRFCSERHSAEAYRLLDRAGAHLPVLPHCEGCYARIYSERPIDRAVNSAVSRLEFTNEDGTAVSAICGRFAALALMPKERL